MREEGSRALERRADWFFFLREVQFGAGHLSEMEKESFRERELRAA